MTIKNFIKYEKHIDFLSNKFNFIANSYKSVKYNFYLQKFAEYFGFIHADLFF